MFCLQTLAQPPQPNDPGDGVKRSKIKFSGQSHVAYLKGNHEMQQHVSKYFACRPYPPPHLGLGSKGQNPFFQNMVIMHIKLKEITKCSSMVANILPVAPPPPPPPLTPTTPMLGMVSKGQHSTFPEHGHFAYQIKGNHKCSIIVANILPADPLHLTLGIKMSKFSLPCFTSVWPCDTSDSQNSSLTYVFANAKAILTFCAMNSAFPQSCYV